MNVESKIIKDHKAKSNQVKDLKNKLKNRIPIGKLQDMLSQEKKYEVSGLNYHGFYGYDDEGYNRAVAAKEARIELLESLISEYKK